MATNRSVLRCGEKWLAEVQRRGHVTGKRAIARIIYEIKETDNTRGTRNESTRSASRFPAPMAVRRGPKALRPPCGPKVTAFQLCV